MESPTVDAFNTNIYRSRTRRRNSSSNLYENFQRQKKLMNVKKTIKSSKIKMYEDEPTDKTILENHGMRVKYEDYTTIGKEKKNEIYIYTY